MSYPSRMMVAATASTAEAVTKLAEQLGGGAFIDHRDNPSKLPFAGVAVGVCDDIPALIDADVGIYVICERTVKPGSANYYGLFPMLGNPKLSHEQADAHWRDNHGPLAIEHHKHMTHYLQFSVLSTIKGPEFDGFALCGFDTLDDLKYRFYSSDASVQIISDDVASFADVTRTPRRLIAEPLAASDA